MFHCDIELHSKLYETQHKVRQAVLEIAYFNAIFHVIKIQDVPSGYFQDWFFWYCMMRKAHQMMISNEVKKVGMLIGIYVEL